MKAFLTVVALLVVGLMFLYPMLPELFGGTVDDANTLLDSDSPTEIAGIIEDSTQTIGTTLDIVGGIVGVIDYIPRLATSIGKYILDKLLPWI